MYKHGFTLLELLVVMTILSILGAVLITAVSNLRTDTKVSLANAQMQHIIKFIEVARITTGKNLIEITGSGDSVGACMSAESDLNTLGDGHSCIINMQNGFQGVADAIPDQVVMEYFRDPWGSPYGWDENENEFEVNPCRSDYLYSAGPDKQFSGYFGEEDDIQIAVPFFSIACATS